MEYGCIGEKLGHSFSAEIHAQLFDYSYELREIPRGELDAFLRARDFRAINVTIPYKQAVIPYLDEIGETARKIGAVNTVVNRGGRLYGYNTDFTGMRALLARNHFDLSGKKVLILGSGGTSKTALAVAESLGASQIKRVSRSGRDGCITYEEALRRDTDAQVILNTTPCGMYPAIGESPVGLSAFGRISAVADVIYNPLRSALVLAAKQRDIPAAGGLYMLVAQAVAAAEKFTGQTLPESRTGEVYQRIFAEKENIVLTGMPGCGKTTVGKLLAAALGRELVDTDEEIVRRAGMPVTEIFSAFGESGFREKEAAVIRETAARQGLVIATGGGAVLRPENVALLKENGRLFFLDRPLEKLVTTADRPLSSDREKLQRRYEERYGLYCACADTRIDCTGDAPACARAVREAFSA